MLKGIRRVLLAGVLPAGFQSLLAQNWIDEYFCAHSVIV